MDCWTFDGILVRQAQDGFVMVWRSREDGTGSTFLSASPGNGKLKVETAFIQVSLVTVSSLICFLALIDPLSGHR